MKYSFTIAFLIFSAIPGFSQDRYEREHRIVKSQFPDKAHNLLGEKLTGIRKTRFYKEADSSGVHFTARFKKDRLRYYFEFDPAGTLTNIAFDVREVDIPAESWDGITRYLKDHFTRYRIRAMQQQYQVSDDEDEEMTITNAMQNLILSALNYEILVTGHANGQKGSYDMWFDASGNLVRKRNSLPANHDHVLY